MSVVARKKAIHGISLKAGGSLTLLKQLGFMVVMINFRRGLYCNSLGTQVKVRAYNVDAYV